jgi:hypothetical protein
MEPNEKPRSISALIVAIAIIAVVFTAPIITFTAFTEREQGVTLYDALLDFDEHARSAQVALVIGALLLIGAAGVLVARGLGLLEERCGRFAAFALIASIVPLIAFHAASADRAVSFLGFDLVEISIAFGAFLPVIIGVLFVVLARLIDERVRI